MIISMYLLKNKFDLYFSYGYNVDRWQTGLFFYYYWLILNVYMNSFFFILSKYMYILHIDLLLYMFCRKGDSGFQPGVRWVSSMNKIDEEIKAN